LNKVRIQMAELKKQAEEMCESFHSIEKCKRKLQDELEIDWISTSPSKKQKVEVEDPDATQQPDEIEN
jgi:hypothetical protein